MKIPIEVVGTIFNSSKVGHKVKVADDSDNTGGFLIYEWWDGSNGPNLSNAFDYWVGNPDDLLSFFLESAWQVDWSSQIIGCTSCTKHIPIYGLVRNAHPNAANSNVIHFEKINE